MVLPQIGFVKIVHFQQWFKRRKSIWLAENFAANCCGGEWEVVVLIEQNIYGSVWAFECHKKVNPREPVTLEFDKRVVFVRYKMIEPAIDKEWQSVRRVASQKHFELSSISLKFEFAAVRVSFHVVALSFYKKSSDVVPSMLCFRKNSTTELILFYWKYELGIYNGGPYRHISLAASDWSTSESEVREEVDLTTYNEPWWVCSCFPVCSL